MLWGFFIIQRRWWQHILHFPYIYLCAVFSQNTTLKALHSQNNAFRALKELKNTRLILCSTSKRLNNSWITDLSISVISLLILCKSISVAGLFSHYFPCMPQPNIWAASTEGGQNLLCTWQKCNLQSSAHYCAPQCYILLMLFSFSGLWSLYNEGQECTVGLSNAYLVDLPYKKECAYKYTDIL